jgi:hypothetical protein
MLLACPESGMMWPDANPSVVRRPDGDDLEQQAIAAYLAGRVADAARALQGAHQLHARRGDRRRPGRRRPPALIERRGPDAGPPAR